MAAPSLDGFASSAAGNAFANCTLTTSLTNDVIVVALFIDSPTLRNVASVTASGLTFSLLTAYSGIDPGRGGNTTTLEIWTATSASALTAKVISATVSGTCNTGTVIAFGVNGCYPGAPIDNSGSLPNKATGGTLTYSTNQSDDFLVAAWGSSDNANPGANLIAGWTILANQNNPLGAGLFANFGIYYKTVTTTQTGLTITGPSAGSGGNSFLRGVGIALTSISASTASTSPMVMILA